MNCNSNTAPLINSQTGGCNAGCNIKDINIVCRKIIIPSGQEILGVEGDTNSSFRNFIIPKYSEQGFDLSTSTFYFSIKNSQNEQYSTLVEDNNKIIEDNFIIIKWNITAKETSNSGSLYVSIIASADNFKWQTYFAEFYIEPSLDNITKVNSPVLLQEQYVVPTKEQQIIVPPDGYGGFSKVIVSPISTGDLQLNDVFDSISVSNGLKKTTNINNMNISGEDIDNRALTNTEADAIFEDL